MVIDLDEHMTGVEVCYHGGFSGFKLKTLRDKGILNPIVISPRCVRYSKAEFYRYMASRDER